jgi:hypothetical protein
MVTETTFFDSANPLDCFLGQVRFHLNTDAPHSFKSVAQQEILAFRVDNPPQELGRIYLQLRSSSTSWNNSTLCLVESYTGR